MAIHPKCNQCAPSTVNGVFIHERGCPNDHKQWDATISKWVTMHECPECGSHHSEAEAASVCCAPVPTYRVLSIDAWREAEGGWTWNNWHCVGTVPRDIVPGRLTTQSIRRLLNELRNEFLSAQSAGQLAVEDDGYNIVIMMKGTRMPVYAIEYGSVES